MGEDSEFFFSLIVNGISIGMLYALIALGFVLVYKATEALNFAQGEFVMLSGYIAAALLTAKGMPVIAAIIGTIAIMIGFSFALERVVLRPLAGTADRRRHHGNHRPCGDPARPAAADVRGGNARGAAADRG